MLFSSEYVDKLWDLSLLHRIEENSFGTIATQKRKKKGGAGDTQNIRKGKQKQLKRGGLTLSSPPAP